MKVKDIMKRINIITGHYGSGKTNLSVNLALKAAEQGKSVAVVDLDLVNPYFRTADFRNLFEEKGIKLIAPDFANTNLDVPSVQFDVEQLASSEDCLIIDVGGDDAAFAEEIAGLRRAGRHRRAFDRGGFVLVVRESDLDLVEADRQRGEQRTHY